MSMFGFRSQFQFKVQFKSLVFAPGLTSSLCTLLLLPLFVTLGFWQLHRMEEKQGFQQAVESQVLTLQDLENRVFESLHYRNLTITGHFINEESLLLDNQTYKGRVGYHVLTPFQPDPPSAESDSPSSPPVILVDRGFIPMGQDRSTLPSFGDALGHLSISGKIHIPQSVKTSHAEILSSHGKQVVRIQIIDFHELSKRFNREFMAFVLKLDEHSAHSFDTMSINFESQINKHLGYAAQWFTIAIVALIYYLAINIKRRIR